MSGNGHLCSRVDIVRPLVYLLSADTGMLVDSRYALIIQGPGDYCTPVSSPSLVSSLVMFLMRRGLAFASCLPNW